MKKLFNIALAVFFLTLVSVFTGCGKLPSAPNMGNFDPSDIPNDNGGGGEYYEEETPAHDAYFNVLLNKFVQLSRSYGGNPDINSVTISFGSTAGRGNRVIGFCQIPTSGKRYIVISREFWNRSDALTDESLLFHELGHCLLNRAHQPNRRPERDLWPVSLMNPYIVRSEMYSPDYHYYQQELFTVNFPRIDLAANVEKTEIDYSMEMHEESDGCVAHEH